MAILLQQYRIIIGSYLRSGLPSKKLLSKRGSKSIDDHSSICMPYMWVLVFLLLLSFPTSCAVTRVTCISTLKTVPDMDTFHMKQPRSSSNIYFLQNAQEELNCSKCDKPFLYNKSLNKMCHILYGNRRNIGYKYFSWNCGRGLLSKNKIEDIKQVAIRHKPHFMGISEVDLRRNELALHDSDSSIEFSTEKIHQALKIEGYKLFLPQSWLIHDKARIIVYVNEEINAKNQSCSNFDSHIQNITLEVGFGRAKKHIVCFYYREWKSCVTELCSKEAQIEYFDKLVGIWKEYTSGDKDFVACGDTNLCALSMYEAGYRHADLANVLKDFLIEESCYQLVNGITRIRSVVGQLQRSCLDHVIVNCINKM